MAAEDDRFIDEDAARAVNSGRETLGAMLGTAQTHLQKVFIVFVIVLLATIYALRLYIWPTLKADLLARGADVVATTPFDVILLQVKIGLIISVVAIIPALIYYGRQPLKERGFYPDDGLAQPVFVGVGALAAVLFVGGITYAYNLFFPLMFDFLANNATSAGFSPTYSIVDWTEFIFILALSFGLAAELPLAMSGLGYTGIVRYETFRDKWKYAVVGIFGFGALFSPPDPFTQAMWAAPLISLYVVSLGLTRLVVRARRSSEMVDVRGLVRKRWNHLAGVAVVVGGVVYAIFTAGGVALVNDAVLPALPAAYRPGPLAPVEEALGLPRGLAVGGLSVAVGLLAAVALLVRIVFRRLGELEAMATVHEPGVALGDPTAIDLANLDADGVRAAPPEAFVDLTEEEALGHARTAMEADDPEKAQAILDRFDEAHEAEEQAGEADAEEGMAEAAADDGAAAPEAADGEATEGDRTADAPADADPGGDGGGGGNVVGDTATGMIDAFTGEETDEDDIGGYYHDVAFIFDSLTSKMFRIVGSFVLVMAGVFTFLYSGGFGAIRADFISRIPPEVRPDPENISWPVTLHPVEALVFEVKISTLIAIVAVLPMVLYYAWPAMEERGFIGGDRNVMYKWGLVLFAGLVAGSAIGYVFVAPPIISYLVQDAIQANMIISYRVNSFFWLVFLTTTGIGLLANVPITMVMFQRASIVAYETFRNRWRIVAITVFALAGLLTPDSVYTMFIVAIPTMLAYWLGLALLWPTTLRGRGRGGSPEPA